MCQRAFFILLLVFQQSGKATAASSVFEVQVNEIVCLLNFLETAAQHRSTSVSYYELIQETFGEDEEFVQLVNNYNSLNLNQRKNLPGYPFSRHRSVSLKDQLWDSAARSDSFHEFRTRTDFLLKPATQQQLIENLLIARTFYQQLIPEEEFRNIQQFKDSIESHLSRLASLYSSVSTLYKAKGNEMKPVQISLTPIPLKYGATVSVAKKNTIILRFLTKSSVDYKKRLGVIVHELCHILYDRQPVEFQHQIDAWFMNHSSPHSKISYNFFDEAMATAIGNGIAYRSLNNMPNKGKWYANETINRYAQSLAPLVSRYLKEEKPIDKPFVSKAVRIFAREFPESVNMVNHLLNEAQIYTTVSDEEEKNRLVKKLRKLFGLSSWWITNIDINTRSVPAFQNKAVTKLFIIDRNHEQMLRLLGYTLEEVKHIVPENAVYNLYDEDTESRIIIISVQDIELLSKAFTILLREKALEPEKKLLLTE